MSGALARFRFALHFHGAFLSYRYSEHFTLLLISLPCSWPVPPEHCNMWQGEPQINLSTNLPPLSYRAHVHDIVLLLFTIQIKSSLLTVMSVNPDSEFHFTVAEQLHRLIIDISLNFYKTNIWKINTLYLVLGTFSTYCVIVFSPASLLSSSLPLSLKHLTYISTWSYLINCMKFKRRKCSRYEHAETLQTCILLLMITVNITVHYTILIFLVLIKLVFNTHLYCIRC